MRQDAESTPRATTSRSFLAQLGTLHAEARGGRVPKREVFGLAKVFIDMPPAEIERLLDHRQQEARVGAVSIMDFQARRTSTPRYAVASCAGSTCAATTASTRGT